MNYSFELGPIRPPSEAHSILLRLTRNCPWNKCAFCPTYKGLKFALRTVEEVKGDIDSLCFILEQIKSRVQGAGTLTQQMLHDISMEYNIPAGNVDQVAFWIHYGMKSLFLQDADSLIMKTGEVVEILNHIREKIPTISRVTSYARAHTISRKSPEELKALREAGLSRIHIGMESGCDEVLEIIKKGVTAERIIDGGRKAMEAGFEVSLYFMPGSGGQEHSEANALESARVINAVNPTFVRIRSTVPMPGTPLHDLMLGGQWTPVSELGKVKEIRLLIENLEGIGTTIVSDHIMNLLEEVEGTLPGDRDKMLKTIDRFLAMDSASQDSFIVGRRTGRFRVLSDYRGSSEIEALKSRLIEEFGGLDAAMLNVLTRYI